MTDRLADVTRTLVALASEGENDVISRYHAFAQVLTFVDTYGGQKPAPGHALVAFLCNEVLHVALDVQQNTLAELLADVLTSSPGR